MLQHLTPINLPKLTTLTLLLVASLLPTTSAAFKKYKPPSPSYYQRQYQEDTEQNLLLTEIKNKPVTLLLVTVTAIASIICIQKPKLLKEYSVNPKNFTLKKDWYHCITAGFIHFNSWNLLFSVLTLYITGGNVEQAYAQRWGPYKGRFLYLISYLGSTLSGGLMYVEYGNDDTSRRGTAAGINALIVADILFNPLQKVLGLPNWLFQSLFAFAFDYGIPKFMGHRVAYHAYLGGALFSIAFTIILNPSLLKDFYEYMFGTTTDSENKKQRKKPFFAI